MKTSKVTFEGSHGERLTGYLDQPEDPTSGTMVALFAHCFTCSGSLKSQRWISSAMVNRGYTVMRFDFTGLGESEGVFAETSFSSNVADLVKAADYLAENHRAPRLLVGHSLGGAAVLRAASMIDSIAGVATIAAPFDPHHVSKLFSDSVEKIEEHGEATVSLAGRPFVIRREFLDDLERQRPEKILPDLRLPLMILHAPTDQSVGIDNAARIFELAKHPKSFVSLDQADHLLMENRDAQYAGEVIATWARRYLSED